MNTESNLNTKENEDQKLKFKINNINRIILNILCTEAIRKIKFILYILTELLKKKTNILHAYITTNIDNLITKKNQKAAFVALQEKIELCENENEYQMIKKEIEKYIETLSGTNEILCQNAPEDRNLKENRIKIIQDGTLLLNIFRKLQRLDFSAVTNELRTFKDEHNLLMNLKESAFHKRQIIKILKEQIEEQLENTTRKRKAIEESIEQIEKEKKIFFVKSMLYYIYKNEYVQAHVFNYNMNVNFKTNLYKKKREEMDDCLATYENINNYIQGYLNKRNDRLQHIHDELVHFFEKEKLTKKKKVEELEKEIEKIIQNIELKKCKLDKYEAETKCLEDAKKNELKKEIAEKEYTKSYNEYILFLQAIGRKKIIEDAKKKKKLLKEETLKKKNQKKW